jgi:hypothetical protein
VQEVNLPDIEDDDDDGPACPDLVHPWAPLFSGAGAMGKGNPKAKFVIRSAGQAQSLSATGSTPRTDSQLSRGLLSSSMCDPICGGDFRKSFFYTCSLHACYCAPYSALHMTNLPGIAWH